MANLIASRGAQTVLNAEFTFSFDDQMVPVSGGTAIAGTTRVDFGKTNTAATAFDIIGLPPGAVVIDGDLCVTTAFDTASYAVIVGDSGSTNRYLSTADRKAAALVPLVPTGYVGAGEPIRITITNADACTTGLATVRVQYIVPARRTENTVA